MVIGLALNYGARLPMQAERGDGGLTGENRGHRHDGVLELSTFC